MRKHNHNRKGQAIIEYSLLIAAVVGALVAMQVYLRRGLQGGLNEQASRLGPGYSPNDSRRIVKSYSHNVINETSSIANDKINFESEAINETVRTYANSTDYDPIAIDPVDSGPGTTLSVSFMPIDTGSDATSSSDDSGTSTSSGSGSGGTSE